MSCHCNCNSNCNKNEVVDIIGLCDTDKIIFANPAGTPPLDRNWTEISVPELLNIPCQKPDVESVDKVFINVKILSKKVVETPAPTSGTNAEGTKLTGKKMIVEGMLHEKIVYTALVTEQTVHSASFDYPFSAFIVLNSSASLEDEFCIETCIEDVYVKVFNNRQIFKNVTLFLRALPNDSLVGCP